MTRDGPRSTPSRRDLLAGVPPAVAVGVAGCSLEAGDTGSTAAGTDGDATPYPASCPTDLPSDEGPLTTGLIPVGPDEYSESTLQFLSFAPRVTHRHGAWYDLVSNSVGRFDHLQDLFQFRLARADQVRSVQPPGNTGFPGYLEYETTYSRHRLEVALAAGSGASGAGGMPELCTDCIEVTPRQGYRGFAVRSGSRAALDVLAYDDERIVIAPEAGGATGDTPEWQVSSERRFRRLVDRRRGDVVPHYCGDPGLTALARETTERDFLDVLFRIDDATFDEGEAAPAGARAHALGVDFAFNPDGTATPDTADVPVSTLGVELAVDYRVAFPDPDEVDRESVFRFLDRTMPVSNALAFEDPDVERSGRVLTISERRPLPSVVST